MIRVIMSCIYNYNKNLGHYHKYFINYNDDLVIKKVLKGVLNLKMTLQSECQSVKMHR